MALLARCLSGALLLAAAGCQQPRGFDGARGPGRALSSAPAAGETSVSELLQPIREKHGVPALAATVVTVGGPQQAGVVGVRKWGTETPAGSGDLWHLGSNTKAMTAVLAARLVESGKMTWQVTPAELFPEYAEEFRPEFSTVTLMHLLNHRAGIPANLDWGLLAQTGTVREQRLQAVRMAFSSRPEGPPGTTLLYSNLGYVVAGAMIERVVDRSWEEAMREGIFAPLGMRSAGFGGVGTPGELDQPWGHSRRGQPVGENGPGVDNPPVLGPAGCVHCTLADWGRFVADVLRGLRGEQPVLLSSATYRMILLPSAFGADYGLGWGVAERAWGGGTVLNHCGCNTMFYANAWVAPQRGFAILVCCNQGADAFAATDEAVSALIGLATATGQGGPRQCR